MKIRLMRAELFHADRQTDTMKLGVTFRHFANALKRSRLSCSFSSQKEGQHYHIGLPEDSF